MDEHRLLPGSVAIGRRLDQDPRSEKDGNADEGVDQHPAENRPTEPLQVRALQAAAERQQQSTTTVFADIGANG